MIDPKIEEAKRLIIPLFRNDIRSIKVNSGVSVRELKKFICDLDDDLTLELDSYCEMDYGYGTPYLDHAELYYYCVINKTEEDLKKEIKAALDRQENKKKEAEVQRLAELARIEQLQLELSRLRQKHGL